MPALPNAANIIKAGFKMGLGTDVDAFVRLFLKYGGATTTSNMDALAAALAAAWNTWLAPVAPNQVTLTEVTTEDLTTNTSPGGSASVSHVGSLTGGLSAAASVVISAEIARRYRGGHPRSYWPFGDESVLNSAQTWTSVFVGDVATAYAGFVNDIATSFPTGITYAGFWNVSYFSGFDNHTYPSGRVKAVPRVRSTPTLDLINSFVIRQSVGSQRRRNQFVN